jgi:N-acetylmuramoyl-L-alanine amidase
MTSPLRIIVTQGHRNTSGGNPGEQARTPAIANAITDALNRAGHEATCLQNDDGSRDNWFNGSLDAVARRVMQYHGQRHVDLLLDIHIESDPANTPGVFAIVPDGTGLKTLTAYSGLDRATPASRDYRLARAIAQAVARSTSLRLRTRGMLEPGVMSEQQTHVGADLGWRLAMFGYTAPARERMARIVLECGNLVADAAIIARPDFAARVAAGVVAGIAQVSGPIEEPAFPPFGTLGVLTQPRTVTVIATALHIREYAETDQDLIATLATGSTFPVCGWVIGESVDGNPVWWITGRERGDAASGWRMWSGGTDLAGAEVLKLPSP